MQHILIFLFSIAFSFCFYNTTLSSDNTTYAIEEIHQYDDNLYATNICVQKEGYSPRYCANIIISTLMHLFKQEWADIGILIIYFNYILYGIVAANSVCRLSSSRALLYSLLLLSCINQNSLGNLAFGLDGAADVFLGTGIPLSFLGISFILGPHKRWTIAWICCALAALMHIHEGMWGGCTVGVIGLSYTLAKRKFDWIVFKGLLIYAAIILVITIPALLQIDTVDNELFVNIYAYIRTPHHLLPTNWGIKNILICFGLICIPVFFMTIIRFRRKYQDFDEDLFINIGIIILWLAILGVEFWATVIDPNATIVTMYLPKCFKYIVFASMLSLLKLIDFCMEDHLYISAFLMVGILVFGQQHYDLTFVLAIALLLINTIGKEKKLWNLQDSKLPEIMEFLLWFSIIYYLSIQYSGKTRYVVVLMYVILFMIRFILPYLNYKKWFYNILCLMGCLGVIYTFNGRILRINSKGIHYISGTECLVRTMGEELYQLSLEFQKVTDKDTEFLADPYNASSGWVQLVSKRSCYAIYKCTPSSKRAVLEWYNRILETAPMTQMNGDEIAELLEKLGLEYVLIWPEQYELLENTEHLEVVAKNNVAAFYRLKI